VVEGQLKFRSRLVRVAISQRSLSAYHDPSLQAPITAKLGGFVGSPQSTTTTSSSHPPRDHGGHPSSLQAPRLLCVLGRCLAYPRQAFLYAVQQPRYSPNPTNTLFLRTGKRYSIDQAWGIIEHRAASSAASQHVGFGLTFESCRANYRSSGAKPRHPSSGAQRGPVLVQHGR
jgi:hypothetical protein